MLFIDANDYSGVLADSVGALITVHSPYVKPVVDENSIFVAPGSAAFVSLHTVCSYVRKWFSIFSSHVAYKKVDSYMWL